MSHVAFQGYSSSIKVNARLPVSFKEFSRVPSSKEKNYKRNWYIFLLKKTITLQYGSFMAEVFHRKEAVRPRKLQPSLHGLKDILWRCETKWKWEHNIQMKQYAHQVA